MNARPAVSRVSTIAGGKGLSALLTLALSAIPTTSTLAQTVDVLDLTVEPVSCKANRITWRRPAASSLPCGEIAGYRVYRNDRLVSSAAGFPFVETNPYYCPQTTFVAPGDSGAGVDLVDEASSHDYRVNAVDHGGVEHPTAVSTAINGPECPQLETYTLPLDMTLVTFSDVVEAGCDNYPCVREFPVGIPFTVEQTRTDLFDKSGVANDLPPLAWILQQQAPGKEVEVDGDVRGWVVLGPRDSYCSPPYVLSTCRHAHDRMVADAILARGERTRESAYIDGFFFYGTDSGPYASAAKAPALGQVRFFTKVEQGNRLRNLSLLEHELGHLGLFPKVSARSSAHAFSLRCPGGIAIGPDLEDLSKDAAGQPGQCKAYDYGDSNDAMGNQLRYYSGYTRWRFGLIDRNDVMDILEAPKPASHQVLLGHLNADYGHAARLLRIPLQENPNDTSYLVEYRGGPEWREHDYRAHCPGGVCGGSTPAGASIPRGVYVRLAVRNPVALGTSLPGSPTPFSPNGSVRLLALQRETTPGNYEPLYLDEARATFCDPYRKVRIDLIGFSTQEQANDTAAVSVTRGVSCL